MTGNVQLYLTEADQVRPWMGGPLGGIAPRVKVGIAGPVTRTPPSSGRAPPPRNEPRG